MSTSATTDKDPPDQSAEPDEPTSGRALWLGLLVGVVVIAGLCVLLAIIGWRAGVAPAG